MRIRRRLARRTAPGGHLQSLSEALLKPTLLLIRPALRRVFDDSTAAGPWRRHDLSSILLDEPVLEPGGHDWFHWRSAFVPFATDVTCRLDPGEEAE